MRQRGRGVRRLARRAGLRGTRDRAVFGWRCISTPKLDGRADNPYSTVFLWSCPAWAALWTPVCRAPPPPSTVDSEYMYGFISAGMAVSHDHRPHSPLFTQLHKKSQKTKSYRYKHYTGCLASRMNFSFYYHKPNLCGLWPLWAWYMKHERV